MEIGFLNSCTTFSSFCYETLILTSKGNYAPALLYSLGQETLGLAAAYAGLFLVRSGKGFRRGKTAHGSIAKSSN